MSISLYQALTRYERLTNIIAALFKTEYTTQHNRIILILIGNFIYFVLEN